MNLVLLDGLEPPVSRLSVECFCPLSYSSKFLRSPWCWCKDSNLDRAPIQGLQGISLLHCQLCYTSQSGPGGWIPTSDLGVRTAPLCSLSYARSKPGTAGGTLTPDLRVRSAALYTSKLQRPKLRAPGRIRTSNSRLKRPARSPFRHESKFWYRRQDSNLHLTD